MQVSGASRAHRAAYAALPPVVAISFVILALSFTEWYEGNEHAGVADHLFGAIRVLGWRGDVVFLLLTAGFALLMLITSMREWQIEKRAKRTALLSAAWLVGYIFYLNHLRHLIYMG